MYLNVFSYKKVNKITHVVYISVNPVCTFDINYISHILYMYKSTIKSKSKSRSR